METPSNKGEFGRVQTQQKGKVAHREVDLVRRLADA
jgi:hypothetical protein